MPWENARTWVFRSTGRRVEHVNGGIFGIDARGVVFDGYDGSHYEFTDAQVAEDCDGSILTDEERAELADEMVARWERFRRGDG